MYSWEKATTEHFTAEDAEGKAVEEVKGLMLWGLNPGNDVDSHCLLLTSSASLGSAYFWPLW